MKLAPLPRTAAAAAAALPPVEIMAPELAPKAAETEPAPAPELEPEPEAAPPGFLEIHTPMVATDGVFRSSDCFVLSIDGARFIPDELAITNV
eukprot:COSAG02_NODE_15554_length_1160_cov_3.098021_2_plen_93_part_00